MNEEDSIKICWLNVLAMRWDCRRTAKIILRSVYVAWCSRWFFPLPSISARLMLGCSRPARSFPWTQTNWELLYDRGGASHPAFARQWLGTPFRNRFVLLFPFWKRAMSKEPVWPMAQAEGMSKRHDCFGAAKWNPTPHLPHEFRNELADLAVFLTQVTQLGRCQKHLFWEQQVHLMKTAGLLSILCTLTVFQILVFKKALFKAFRFTFLTENYGPCNIWMMKL